MRGPLVRPIIIAAGGTGGHMFPAEALTARLIAQGERVVLLTDSRAAARAANSSNSAAFGGCEIHAIPGEGVAGRGPLRALSGLKAIGSGVLAARRILAPLAPAAVVGFGGYPAVAPVLAARSLRHRPVLILHDQNAVLGRANLLLARLADHIALSFPATAGLPAGRQARLTGNPVRPAIAARAAAPYAPPAATINLLVLGGSLGASVFATLIPAALARLPAASRARIALTMQCPAPLLETARETLAAAGITAVLAPFFADVDALLQNAHLVISRAGGSTVAELAVIGRPAILIPLRINKDQAANADALAAAGAALRIEQTAGDAALAAALAGLLADPTGLKAMAAAAARFGIADAADRLAALTLEAVAATPARENGAPSPARERAL